MHRAIPVGNKACHQRIQQRNHEMHKKRVQGIRPLVDTREPGVCTLDHLRTNLKREQFLEERYFEIDRDNRILLTKMSDIMKHPSYSQIRARSGPPSLNRDQRKQELMRVTNENQKILKRIQLAQPIYNHIEWDEAHKRNKAYVKNSSEYPPCLGTSGRRAPSRGGLAPLMPKDANRDKFLGMEDATGGGGGAGGAEGGAPNDQLRYLYKQGQHIGTNYFLVEMATDGHTLAISAYDGNSQKTLELLVNEKNHRRLFREHGDYNRIASLLRVEGDSLLLDAPPAAYDTGSGPA